MDKKNMHTFYQLGKKMCIFPPFFIPFQSFFPPNTLFGHIFIGSNRKIYNPMYNIMRSFYEEFRI